MSKKKRRSDSVRPQLRGFRRFAPLPPWSISAWLRGYAAVPDAIELVPGWTLTRVSADGREPVIVSPSLPHAQVGGAVGQAPGFQLTGTVVARTRSAARDTGLATAQHVINLAAIHLEVLFEDIVDIEVLGPDEAVAFGVTRQPMERVLQVSATATRRLSADLMARVHKSWRTWEESDPSRQDAVVRASDWWRRALVVGKVDPVSGLLCAWAAVEALASLANTTPRTSHCPKCQAPLVCSQCKKAIPAPGPDLRKLLTNNWGLSRDEFDQARDLRNYLVHGGTPPVPLSEVASRTTRILVLILTAVRQAIIAET